MNTNKILFLVLLISLLIISSFFVKNRIQNIVNNKLDSNIFINHPENSNYKLLKNITCSDQRLDKLKNTLKQLSGGDKSLTNCIMNKYINGTINVFQKKDLNNIITIINNKITELSNYKFIAIECEDLMTFTDKNGVVAMKFNIYMYEPNYQFMSRFKIDLIKYPKKVIDKKINTCSSVTTPEFPTYEIGIASKDQLIPLPTEVTPSANDILSTKGVNPVIVPGIEYLYINSIELFNSDLVLSYYGAKKLANIKGISDGTIEFSKYLSENYSPIQDCSYKRNKWITLNNMPKNQGQYPCMKPSLNWNIDGIPTPVVKPTKNCPGVRSSPFKWPLQGQYWRALTGTPVNSGPNYWLFDLGRGVPAFMTGTRG